MNNYTHTQARHSSPTSTSSSSYLYSSSYKLTAEAVAGVYPPPRGISYNEIMNPCFSPPQPYPSEDDTTGNDTCGNNKNQQCSHRQSNYLSFLAPTHYPCINSSANKGNSRSTDGMGDRKLFVIHLKPFWEYISSQYHPGQIQLVHSQTAATTTPVMPTISTHQHIAFATDYVQPLLYPQINDPFTSPHRDNENKNNTPENTSTSTHSVVDYDTNGFTMDNMPSATTFGNVLTSSSPYNLNNSHSYSSTSSSINTSTSPKNSHHHHHTLSLEERLRRERQRITISPHGMTQFSWTFCSYNNKEDCIDSTCTSTTKDDSHYSLRLFIPYQNSLYIQQGIPRDRSSTLKNYTFNTNTNTTSNEEQYTDPTLGTQWWCIYDPKSSHIISNPSFLLDLPKIKSPQGCNIPNNTDTNHQKNDSEEENDLCTTSTSTNIKPRKRLYPELALSPKQSKKVENTPSTATITPTTRLQGLHHTPMDPQLSPDGTMVAFVMHGNLFVVLTSRGPEKDDILGGGCSTDSSLQPQQDFNVPYYNPVQITFTCTDMDHSPVEVAETDEKKDVPSSTIHHGKIRYGHCVTHGLADFVAQEEMERYHGFWWNPDSKGILFTRVDESYIPPLRIMHHTLEESISNMSSSSSSVGYEEHRYPFSGEINASVILGYLEVHRDILLKSHDHGISNPSSPCLHDECINRAQENFSCVKWLYPPDEASEYLTAVHWLQNGNVVVQWQNRAQTTLLFLLWNVTTGQCVSLCKETSDSWINLNHIFEILPRTVDPEKYFSYSGEDEEDLWDDNSPTGSFSFIIASERTGFCHLYLYTYRPEDGFATPIRPITTGNWIVDSIDGIDLTRNVVYVSGTYDSALEKHLYAVALLDPETDMNTKLLRDDENRMRNNFWQGWSTRGNPSRLSESVPIFFTPRVPLRLTQGFGMHNVILDYTCRLVIDTYSDLHEPISTRLFYLPPTSRFQLKRSKLDQENPPWSLHPLWTLYDTHIDMVLDTAADKHHIFTPPPPEVVSFASSDPSCILYAALYRPDPKQFGNGPYPLICSVYGGPHVQRVNRSWQLTMDLRAQYLCSLGFAVVKCDNRGSSRRGKVFEIAIKGQLGNVEVLDQAQCVRILVMRGIADPSRVGIYGWSYGGYLAAMCLCKLPDIFQVAVCGAPVTTWFGYDTHYTERYLGLPTENEEGYRKSSIFEHIQSMKGRILIIHGLIDENVHWRHSANLINQLTAAGKSYDLCVFPDERHSPRKLKNRIYLEHKIREYFLEHLRVGRERGSGGNMGRSSSPDTKPFGRL